MTCLRGKQAGREGIRWWGVYHETPSFVPSAPIVRTWTDSTGKFRIEAELIWLKNGQVRLKKKSGGFTNLPLEKLSTKDRLFLKSKRRASAKK